MIRSLHSICLCIILLITGCDKRFEDPVPEASYGYEYYPLQTGKYYIFSVDSIQFDLLDRGMPVSDTGRFFLREEISDSYHDAEGNTVFRVERSRSVDKNGPWTPLEVFTLWRNDRQMFRVENNIKIIPLIFPIKVGSQWDGLAFIPDGIQVSIKGESVEFYKDWSFEILSLDQNENIGGTVYPETTTVQHADNENLIELRFALEKFAKGIGLVYREYRILDTYCKYEGDNTPCQGDPWSAKAGRGFIFIQMLVDHN